MCVQCTCQAPDVPAVIQYTNRWRSLIVIVFCLSVSCSVFSQPTREKPLPVEIVYKPTKPTPPCADPGGKISGKIGEGENLITARQPDQAIAVCNPALETKCSDLRDRAQGCVSHAIAEKRILDEISQELGAIDFDLGSYRYGDAAKVAEKLGYDTTAVSENSPKIEDGIKQQRDCAKLGPDACSELASSLAGYIETELNKRTALRERHPSLLVARGYLGEKSGISPPPPLSKWLLWLVLFVLFAWMVRVLLRYCWWLRIRKNWIVWSVVDENKSGASGALMDALDWEADPLLQTNEDGERLLCWLAPPFLPDDIEDARSTTTVWRDLAAKVPKTEEIWDIDENLREARRLVPDFILDPAYQELDVNIGGFTVKGLSGLRKFALQSIFARSPSIIGVVTRREVDGHVCWGVRLNANMPRQNRTMSVFAESLPQEYGDPLAQVAQRAALKLMLRIGDGDTDANTVTAQAAYRQGIELLKQLS